MEIRKADSKGRLNIGEKERHYHVEELPDGTLRLFPVKEHKGMRIIEKDRHGGKTTELVEFMLEPGNEDVFYIAPTNVQAQGVALPIARSILQERGEDIPAGLSSRFLSASALTQGPHLAPMTRVVIDEIDGVLSGVLRLQVLAIAGTDARKKHGD